MGFKIASELPQDPHQTCESGSDSHHSSASKQSLMEQTANMDRVQELTALLNFIEEHKEEKDYFRKGGNRDIYHRFRDSPSIRGFH